MLSSLGLAAFVSYIGLIVAVHVSDWDGLQGDWGWAWIAAGYYGGLAALIFGGLALVLRRRPPRRR